MIETNTTADYTEIYVGGGNYITQSAPTNFHTFYKQKILTAEEHIEDFREVTAAEREALEQSDAAWSRPPQSFIDQWNGACSYNGKSYYFGKYNECTGFFELNGINDIDYVEAMKIWRLSKHDLRSKYVFGASDAWGEVREACFCRTYFPIKWPSYVAPDLTNAFTYNTIVETITVIGGYGISYSNYGTLRGTFNGCRRLREIQCLISLPILSNSTFEGCNSLETLNISLNTSSALNLQWSPALSYDSITRMVNQARESPVGAPTTITLHPQAYARVTEEIFALAAEKNITIAST